MADEPDAIDQLLDAALYLPVGFLLELRERSPELAARGRQHLQSQVAVARMIGQFAVQMGSKQVASYLQRPRSTAPAGPVVAEPVVVEPAVAEPAVAEPIVADEPVVPTPGAVASDGLPIDGYDTLAASQVVARLDGLDGSALEAVRAYEAAHRNRKTVLGKVAQLQRAG